MTDDRQREENRGTGAQGGQAEPSPAPSTALKTVKLVTIVSEAVLQERLLGLIKKAGATGWSLSKVVGEGTRGVHASDWEGRNVKIETLVSPQTCTTILEKLAEKYFPRYAVVAYVQDVQVVRGSKYVQPNVDSPNQRSNP